LPAACFNQYNVAVSPPDNQLNAVQRKLELRDAELKEAHRHIAALEGKLLKLKEYRRELKQLKEKGDVDFCLKIRCTDYLIVYTPFAKLHWHATHDDKQDTSGDAILRQRWANVSERDPYYNPNLSRERADFSLETP
jgi:hypothetical protein